jgi:hypothetical protein
MYCDRVPFAARFSIAERMLVWCVVVWLDVVWCGGVVWLYAVWWLGLVDADVDVV